jgi:hypothetical protein
MAKLSTVCDVFVSWCGKAYPSCWKYQKVICKDEIEKGYRLTSLVLCSSDQQHAFSSWWTDFSSNKNGDNVLFNPLTTQSSSNDLITSTVTLQLAVGECDSLRSSRQKQ